MSNMRIITDAASDLSYELEKELDIRVIPFDVVIGEKSYVSRVDFDNQGFYDLMHANDDIPKTAQITPFQFEEIYLEEAKKGYTDIFVVLLNSKGSSTFGNSLMAKESFFDEHPEYEGKITIHNYDGIGYSGLYGMPVVHAAKMIQKGAHADVIDAYLSDCLPKRRIYFGMYTLKYAGKSGRIPSAAAFVGEKLNIKPIMKICDNEIATAAKVRGDGKIMSKVIDLSLNDMKPGSAYSIIYGENEEAKDEIAKIMTEKVGYGPEGYFQIGAVVAADAGPAVTGIAFTTKDELV